MLTLTKNIAAPVFVISTSTGAFIYVFIFADRTGIFLYEHLGAGPFDRLTSGRYWMAGFVVAGLISLTYFFVRVIFNLPGRKIIPNKGLALPTAVLIFTSSIIITRLGQPPLPLLPAISAAFTLTFAVHAGIGFINDLFADWLPAIKHAVIAVGIIPFVLFFRIIELPHTGILPVMTAFTIVISLYLSAVVWMIIFKWMFRNEIIKVMMLFKTIVVMAWLVFPVIHFFMTVIENHPYITASDNFFASSILLRILNWVIVGFIVLGISTIKFRLKDKTFLPV